MVGVAKAALIAALLTLAGAQEQVLAQRASRSVSFRDILTLRDIEGFSVSPDERLAIFQIREANIDANGYDTAWYVMPTDGTSRPVRLAPAGTPIQPRYQGRVNGYIDRPAPIWSPDSRVVYYLRQQDGETQLWRSRLEGGATERVNSVESDVVRFVLTSDGVQLLLETQPTQAQADEALAVEGQSGFLYDNRFFPSYSRTPTLPRDAAFLPGAGATTASQVAARRVVVHNLATGAEAPAGEPDQAEFERLTSSQPPDRPNARSPFANAYGARAWTEARDPERQGVLPPVTVVAQRANDAEPIVCQARECTGQAIAGMWWRDGREVMFVRREGDVLEDRALYVWNPGEAAPRLVLRTDDLFASELACAVAQRRLLCLYEEPARPGRLVAIDPDTRRVETLFDPNPEFADFNIGREPQRLRFESSTGVITHGYLVLPPRHRRGRLPLVIVTYRCAGFLRGGVGDEYPIFPFAAEGFAVLCFNTPSEDFERMAVADGRAYRQWSRGPGDPMKRRVQEALDAAVDQLSAVGVIDPDRVGLTGLSYGAETVSFALFRMRNLRAAIASGLGYEPLDYYLYGPAGRDFLRDRGWDPSPAGQERWRGFSLSLNADQVRAPLLINVGEYEMFSSLQPVTALEDAGRPVEMYVFPNESHIKVEPVHRLAIYQRNIDWMNFWLRDAETGSDAAQYERWRRLRTRAAGLSGQAR